MDRAARSTNGKKGVSLSINMVVVAVIALVVLVIATYIVISKSSSFSQGTNSCDPPNNICSMTACGQGFAQDYPLRNYAGVCPAGSGGEEQICCMKL